MHSIREVTAHHGKELPWFRGARERTIELIPLTSKIAEPDE
jgi:hypothetical protein